MGVGGGMGGGMVGVFRMVGWDCCGWMTVVGVLAGGGGTKWWCWVG